MTKTNIARQIVGFASFVLAASCAAHVPTRLAYVFLAPAQRVTDLLNDGRHFLPFERPDGWVFVVAKRTIRCITPMEMGRQINEKDPYDLLGITLIATGAQRRPSLEFRR